MQPLHIAEWNKKEFIRKMQFEGKLSVVKTEALERKEKNMYDTVERIFPGPTGKEGFLYDMVRKSERNLYEITNQKGKTSSLTVPTSTAPSVSRSHRLLLKEKISALEDDLKTERQRREQAEEQLNFLK
uniref:Uncharacterized protein n=1 Tax=Polytomella parva TaxID=51329 RepID=A0A7S0UQW7_9CHLO|mmetsp:Transcript_18205/g.33245  ORF Transcript_18205/g.33245 Transcript_18205/m.33245 type:complete len:129 (+) Transcript_18205:74-460(+)